MTMILKHSSLIAHLAVKKIFRFDKRFTASFRNIYVEHLKKRALLKISGPDTAQYLQGMVTNDMRIFEPKDVSSPLETCIYTLLLNSHGRVLYDSLLYKVDENDYYLEYDSAAVEYMKKHLDMYRLRRNVTVTPVNDLTVWVAYSPNNEYIQFDGLIDNAKNNEHILLTVCDPRIKELGVRFISKKHVDVKELLAPGHNNVQESYEVFRYRLGIGEGVMDHPPGNCFPFETNVDFLHGVSFQKGCYMGQETTARGHFQSGVRKRIMPIILSSSSASFPKLPLNCAVINENEKKLGKLRNHIEKFGLAALNVDECLKAQNLKLKEFDINVTVAKPSWWPLDTNKIKH